MSEASTTSGATVMSGALQKLGDSIADESFDPLPKDLLPFSHRLNCFIWLWLCKLIASIFFIFRRTFYPSPAATRPTLLKRYPCRPRLQNRVFFPPNYKAGDLLPLYLDIHGGGFAFGDPQTDDDFCSSWAKRTGMLVVSLDYCKAPLHPFPEPVHDIAAIARAVIDDEALPVDKTKIVIGGFSAGANLALGASQLPELRGSIKAAVSFYPIVDFGHRQDYKLAMRPYKDGPKDALAESGYWFDWGYVHAGQDRRDPLLSPYYAKKAELPPWICVVAAQYDMLRLEAQEWVHRLAGQQQREDQEVDFEIGTYKWMLALGMRHGFTHNTGRDRARKEARDKSCQMIYAEIDTWLKGGPLKGIPP